ALHASEERYRQLFEGAAEGVYETLPAGGLRTANPAFARMLGFDSPAALLAQSAAAVEKLYAAPDRRQEFFAALARHDYLKDFESEIHRRDGAKLWISENVRVVRDQAGAVRYFQGFVTDITARKQAETALRESEERWRLAVQGSAAGIWENNMLTGESFYSDRSKEMLGYAPQEISNQREDWVSRIHPDDKPLGMVAMQEHLAGKKSYYQVEHRFRCKDGTYKWILSRGRAQSDEQKRLMRIVGTHVDINERKLAEEELRWSEARYRMLFEHSPIPILELDEGPLITWLERIRTQGVTDLTAYIAGHPEERDRMVAGLFLTGANSAALRLVGATTLKEANSRMQGMMTKEVVGFRLKVIHALWAGRQTYDAEFSMKAMDGTLRHIHAYRWMPTNDGRAQLALVDLTAAYTAQQAFTAERERLSVTLRAMAEGVVSVDNDGVVQFLNDSACRITGWTRADAVGQPLTKVCALRQEKTGVLLPALDALARAGGQAMEIPPQTVLVQPKAGPRLVEGRCAPLHDLAGQTLGAVLVLRDVTEQSRMELELQRASKLESVGILAGGIAHDFNNILAIIMGNLTLALMDEQIKGSPASRWLQAAELGTLRARDLTQQLLTFAKGGEPVRATVTLPELVREAVEFALHGAAVRCEFAIADGLPSAEVDKGQIGQVVQNLVLNAVQAMPGGGIIRIAIGHEKLAADERPPLPAGHYLKLSIADRGAGIRSEHLSRIFEPYFTTKEAGVGLGLATVYSILKKHLGLVTVESVVDVGTTFHLWLPASQAVHAAVRTGSQSPFGLMQGRALFMDDEEPIRQMASILLTRLGLDAVTAADGDEAVRLFQQARDEGRPFNVVVMDLTVPGGVGGLQAMKAMQAIDPQVRAIVSSGYSSDPVLANFRAHGFMGMVAKPYRIADFAQVLRTVLEK
nr:PAS domain S-box protein [Opitutaceae bacterium]